MTGKKAKVKHFDILQFVANNAWLSTFGTIEKAYNAGVSEKEVVLDKIRAEIKKLDYLSIADGSDGYDKYIDQQDVLQIIDKYRAESED